MRFVNSVAVVGLLCAFAGSVSADEARIETAAVVPAVLVDDAPVAEAPVAPRSKRYDTLSVVIGGDLGLNPSGQHVSPDRVIRHGQSHAINDLTAGLKPYLNGDIVFANLETVVTDRNDLAPVDKAFNFRTHPAAIRHLVASGFNVLSTANNHAADYGTAGMAETVRHLSALADYGLRGAPGTGFGRAAALTPSDIKLAQGRVRIAAVGIGGVGGSGAQAAMASYHGRDFHDAGRHLQDADGDVRMLSVHFGQEMQVRPSPQDRMRLLQAVRAHGIDIIAGHHAHVAAGVQEVDGRLIFFGLGNLLHPGMQDMGKYGVCRDFGVLAKVHFGRVEGDRYQVRAVEVWTLKDMHAAVKIRVGEDAKAHLDVLNHHAADLDVPSDQIKGVRFTPQSDGTGLYCTARATDTNDDLAQRCRANAAPEQPAAALRHACGTGDVIAARSVAPDRLAISALHRAKATPLIGGMTPSHGAIFQSSTDR